MQAQTTRPLAGTSWLSGSPQTQGFAWRICGANHLHETRGVLQVYNLEGQVLQLSTVEACLRYFQHFMICPIELRTNLQVIMSSHVIPCYPMSLVLVSRFNWFNVILCGLFFPAHLLHLKNFNLENFQEESHDLKPVTCITWARPQFCPMNFWMSQTYAPGKIRGKPEAILQFPIDTKMLWHHVVPCKS